GFGLGLHLLLERPHLVQRLLVANVGDRLIAAVDAEIAGGFTPALWPYAVLLAEQREEDLRLLYAEPRQRLDALEQVLAVARLRPDSLRVAAVLLDDEPAHVLHPSGHRAGESVQCRRG